MQLNCGLTQYPKRKNNDDKMSINKYTYKFIVLFRKKSFLQLHKNSSQGKLDKINTTTGHHRPSKVEVAILSFTFRTNVMSWLMRISI